MPLDSTTPEPVALVTDPDGTVHLATSAFPPRTLIDIHAMAHFGSWLSVDHVRGRVTIRVDGRVAVYERAATDLHGAWICNLV